MDSESLALASTAAATLVTLLTTEAWTRASQEIASMWHRFRPSQAAGVEAELAQARADVLAGDQAVTGAVVTEWEGRLGRLLAAHAEAAGELARVADTLAGMLAKASAGPAGNVTVTQHVHASGEHATVIQAGRDARIGQIGKVTLGAARVHLQQITAADASVVIQVGRDLYVSDPALTALWTPGVTTPGECPFPGLDAFGPGQARWFFGREKVTGDLLEMLDDALRDGCGGPVTVVGPSGAGKSSLLGAGLLGGLAEGRLPAAGSGSWPRLLITPGAHPSRTLGEALQACAQARGDGAATPTVVVVDQMEEIFTACDDEAERAEFLAALASLAAPRDQRGPAALVVLGLRADFFARATGYPVLRSALASRQIVLGAMSQAELRQAITLPARTAGLTLDGGLVERLLADLGVDETAGYEPGRLPLLAHALRATWQRRDGDRLTTAGYEATGGIGGAIAKTADDVYARLDEAGQSAARQVLLGLVRIGESGEADGAGTADTRRRVSAESLCAGSADPHAARAALDVFIAARLLTSGGHTVEISHEALLRRWPRLRDWISEDRAGHLVRQDLEEAAETWDREGRDGSSLYRGVRLATARAWAADHGHLAELSRGARDFLAAAVRRRRRAARRRNALVAAAIALALVLAGLAGYAVQLRAANAAEGRATESGVLTFQAPEAMALGDVGTAMEFAVQAQRLDPASPQARSGLLSTQVLPFAGRLAASDPASVLSVAYSPGGTVIATSGDDGYVRLWSASSYRQLAAVRIPGVSTTAAVNAVTFSPDRHLLAAASDQGEVSLWNVIDPSRPVSAGILRAGADGTGYGAKAIAISPDGTTLAVVGSDESLQLWNLPRRTLEGSIATGSYIGSLAFLSGGRTLATASDVGSVKLWDVAKLRLKATLPGAGGALGELAVSPDGQTIAFAGPLSSSSGTAPLEFWSVSGHRLLNTTVTVPALVTTMAFSPDGGLLAVGDGDGKLRLYDPRDGYLLLATIQGHRQEVNQVAFSPDGTRVATASDDGTVGLWNAWSNTLGSPDPSRAVAFSPDGHLLAVDTELRAGSGVALYRMPAGKLIATLATGDTYVDALAFSPDGRTLAAGLDSSSSPPAVQLWNTASIRMTGQIDTGQQSGQLSLAFSPDGRTLATGTFTDTTVRLWSATGLTRVAAFSTGQVILGVWALAFSPDGRSLAVANVDGVTEVLSAPGGAVTRSFDDQGDAVAFSPDGRTLAVGSSYGNVYLYAVRGARETHILAQSTQLVSSVAFTPDGQTLITAGYDATIRLSDTATRALTATITTDARGIEALSYSASLGMIATTDGSATRIWRTDPTAVAEDVCATLKAPLTPAEWSTYMPEYPFSPVC